MKFLIFIIPVVYYYIFEFNSKIQAFRHDNAEFCDYEVQWHYGGVKENDTNECDSRCDRFGNETCFSTCSGDSNGLCMKNCSSSEKSEVGPCSLGVSSRHIYATFHCGNDTVICKMYCD